MTYKEFVERPARLRRKVEHKIEDVQLKWTICQSTTAGTGGERVQNTVVNSTENSLFRYLEAKEDLDRLAGELERSRNKVRAFLYENLSEQNADILEWRYIGGRNLQEIAEITGLSYQTMKNRMSAANRLACEAYKQKVNQ